MFEGIIAAGTSVCAFLIIWGASRSTLQEHERRIGINDRQLEALQKYAVDSKETGMEQLHSLRDVYVSYAHFQEVMHSIKDSQRDLKESLDKIVELLSKRS